MDILPEMPEIVRQYALYYRNIKGRAPKTVNEYCSDLRGHSFASWNIFADMFHKIHPWKKSQSTILIMNSSFHHDNGHFWIHELRCRRTQQHELHASAKSSSLKSFFNHLTVHEGLLDSNPTENLTPPKKAKTLPLPHVRAKPRAFKRRGRAG